MARETKTIGRYANILLDDWFKRTFGEEPRKRIMELFLKELIPERKIVSLKYEPQEHFVLVSLDSSNNIIKVHELTLGLVNQTQVHPREAFARAIEDRAVSVIFAHNHPSGNTMPSPEDFAITRVLCAAGKIIQIPVIDHIIIGKRGITSLCREKPEIFEANLPVEVKNC